MSSTPAAQSVARLRSSEAGSYRLVFTCIKASNGLSVMLKFPNGCLTDVDSTFMLLSYIIHAAPLVFKAFTLHGLHTLPFKQMIIFVCKLGIRPSISHMYIMMYFLRLRSKNA